MAKKFEKLILGGLHEKHAVQRGEKERERERKLGGSERDYHFGG
jgi:hypothetical protein